MGAPFSPFLGKRPNGSASPPGSNSIRLDTRPPLDREDRALLLERILPASLGLEDYARGDYPRVHSWAGLRFEYAIRRRRGALEIACAAGVDTVRLAKLIRFAGEGEVTVRYAWSPGLAPEDVFTTELSLAGDLTVEASPAAEIWRHPIETVAKSERGLDRTRQGESLTVRWPARLGEASLTLRPA